MQRIYDGADALLDSIEACGIRHIFGYPGGATIPIYDKIPFHPNLQHILVRHEQATTFGAQGVSRTKQGLAVALVTSGPGASNALTGLFDAYMDNIPMLFVSGQVPLSLIGNDVFQELDTLGATMSMTKHSFLVTKVEDIPRIVAEAAHIATTGRPGPVHIDIPKNISASAYTGDVWEEVQTYQKQHKENKQTLPVRPDQIAEVYDCLRTSSRPVLLLGQGVKFADAEHEAQQRLSALQLPTVSTLLAKGVAGDEGAYLGFVGMHGLYHANMALSQADCIINIGSKFGDRIVGTYESFAKGAKVIHVDIDKAELNKAVDTEIGIHADAKDFLTAALGQLPAQQPDRQAWWKQIHERKKHASSTRQHPGFSMREVYLTVNEVTKANREQYLFATDVGQHQMRAMQYLEVAGTKHRMTSGGAGSMGAGLPMAMGAALANPDKTVVIFAGDGGFQMTMPELQTIKDHELNVKVIILNNTYLGMVRQRQDLFHDKNYSGTPMTSPDFVKLAAAYDIPGYRVDNRNDASTTFAEVLAQKGPALIECKVIKEENIFPMVAPGDSLAQARLH